MQLIGNDVVDISTPRARHKDQDSRFMNRVMTIRERDRIKGSPNPAQVLWMCWAAKEAAYKVMRKVKRETVFSPVQFETLFEVCGQEASEIRGAVNYQGYNLNCRWKIDKDYVHALCVSDKEKDPTIFYEIINQAHCNELSEILSSCRQAFSIEERKSIFHDESYLVRYFLKKELSYRLNCDESDLQVIREKIENKWQAPYILFKGKRFHADLSLSHDGAFLAYAFSLALRPQPV